MILYFRFRYKCLFVLRKCFIARVQYDNSCGSSIFSLIQYCCFLNVGLGKVYKLAENLISSGYQLELQYSSRFHKNRCITFSKYGKAIKFTYTRTLFDCSVENSVNFHVYFNLYLKCIKKFVSMK